MKNSIQNPQEIHCPSVDHQAAILRADGGQVMLARCLHVQDLDFSCLYQIPPDFALHQWADFWTVSSQL